MVYLRQWKDFAAGVRMMQDTSENKSIRYCSKWHHSSGLLTLKVTNNQQCLQFRTRSAVFLNRFQLLNPDIMATMQARRLGISTPACDVASVPRIDETAVSSPQAGSLLAADKAVTGNDSVKKKKPKKRKH